MKTLVRDFKNTIVQACHVQPDSTIVLGVSAGSDSVAMFRLFVEIAESVQVRLVVAHVNYGTRGKDSTDDECFVREIAEKYSIPCEVLFAKKPRRTKINFESYARETRYAFFEAIAQEYHASAIAVAHTQDDQAETILMHLLKGTGVNGLAAMKAREGTLIRPLLGFTKHALREYLKAHKQPFRTDKTNADTKLLRNKIRHILLPMLQKEFNPNIIAALTRLSQSATDVETLIQDTALTFFQKHAVVTPRRISFQRKDLMRVPKVIRREVLHLAFLHFGLVEPLSFSHFDEIEKIVQRNIGNKQKEIARDLKISLNHGVVSIQKQ